MSETDTAPPYLRFMLNAVLASLTIDSERDVADLMLERQAAAAMLAAFQVRNAIEAGLAAQAVTAFHAYQRWRRGAVPRCRATPRRIGWSHTKSREWRLINVGRRSSQCSCVVCVRCIAAPAQ